MVTKSKKTAEKFVVSVREHKFTITPPSGTSRFGSPGPCPATPKWLGDLVANGAELDLNEVKIEAGRHFASSIVPGEIPGQSTRRGKAGELAGFIIAMAKPRVSSARRLWFARQHDPDIQRWCSELLGVGAGISLLHTAKVVDMRTTRKISSDFDYVGRAFGSMATIDLEFKGTVNNASNPDHRASFRKKLENTGRLGPPQSRGYDQAIGVIFSGWTRGSRKKRGADFELMDPGEPAEPNRENALRELLVYYATRYEEVVGMAEAAQTLRALSLLPDLLDGADLSLLLGIGARPGRFSRSAVSVRSEQQTATYWGSFWEAGAAPYPSVSIGGRSSIEYRYAYLGIDQKIILSLRNKDFATVLDYRTTTESFTFADTRCQGIGLVLSDGTAIIWSSELLPAEIVVESA